MGVVMYDQLKAELEEAAFMLVDDARRHEIHSKLVNCLVILDKWKDNDSEIDRSSNDEAQEIKKVSRRLKLWAKSNRQSQYNSKILNAYLELRRSGKTKISEEDIKSKLGLNTWFSHNFLQMKIIADRNHGKVFEVKGEYVNIWKPVEAVVNNYEKQVFENV